MFYHLFIYLSELWTLTENVVLSLQVYIRGIFTKYLQLISTTGFLYALWVSTFVFEGLHMIA